MFEPTTATWKALKMIFLVINSCSSISVIYSIYSIVSLTILAFFCDSDQETKRQLQQAQLTQDFLVFMIIVFSIITIFNAVSVIIGFVGVLKPNLKCLVFYTLMLYLQVIAILMVSIYYSYIISILSLLCAPYIILCHLLMRELKYANEFA